MQNSPAGTLTFLMTDIEGSTRMWESDPDAMGKAVLRSEAIIHEIVGEHGGHHVSEQGEGDSTLSVFTAATSAAQAAVAIRERLAVEPWPSGIGIRVRMGLHSGVADIREQTYYGRVVNRAARVRSVAHGGQIVLTRITRDLLDPRVFSDLKDHGMHRLKDLLQPEHLFEIPGEGPFPPLQSLSRRPTNLPIQLTSFVGRQADIAAVRARLAQSRIVTLLASGGSGKTRLALQVAAEVSDNYRDGVFFVDLTSARTEDDVRLGVLRAVKAEACAELAETELLLVLDNCEHLIEAASTVANELLTSCPGIVVLATSRETLQLRAELTYRVPPLSLPSEEHLGHLESVERSEAVQLFVERACAKVANFALTSANCRAVGSICRHLDGLPLALELAAPRLKVLSPNQLLNRLSERFALLKDVDQSGSARHRTLLATIEQSYDLLDEQEKCLLRHVSVFANGWSLQAAEAIAPQDMRSQVLGLTESLIDKSLIQVEEVGWGEPRTFLLESIREFGRLKLMEAGETDSARGRLAECLIEHLDECRERLRAGDTRATDLLDLALTSVHETLDWSIRAREAELGLRLSVAIWEHWRRRGGIGRGRAAVERLLELVEPQAPLHATALNVLGTLRWYQEDLEGANAAFERSFGLYSALDDARGMALAGNNLGMIAASRGDSAAASDRFSEARERFREVGDIKSAISAGVNLARAQYDMQMYVEAEQSFRQVLASAEALAESDQLAILYVDLAETCLRLEKLDEALGWLAQAFASLEAAGYENYTTKDAFIVSANAVWSLGDGEIAETMVSVAECIRCHAEMPRDSRIHELVERLGSTDAGGQRSALHRDILRMEPRTAIDHGVPLMRRFLAEQGH